MEVQANSDAAGSGAGVGTLKVSRVSQLSRTEGVSIRARTDLRSRSRPSHPGSKTAALTQPGDHAAEKEAAAERAAPARPHGQGRALPVQTAGREMAGGVKLSPPPSSTVK